MTSMPRYVLPLALLAAAGCTPRVEEPASQAATAPMPAAQAAAPTATAPDTATEGDGLAAYRRNAASVQARMAAGADVVELRTAAESLMEQGAALVPGYIERFPACRAYLEAAVRVRETWRTLDVATLERDYHHDGALPKVADTPICYHIKDLVVHPASALVLLGQTPPDLVQARAEIDEVVQHAGFIESRATGSAQAAPQG